MAAACSPPSGEGPDALSLAGVWFSTASSTRLPAHAHAGTEFNLVLAGHVTYSVGGHVVVVRAGELVALPAAREHELLETSEDAALWVVEAPEPLASFPERDASVHTLSIEQRLPLQRLLRKLWLRPAQKTAERLARELLVRLNACATLPHQPITASTGLALHPAVERARALCERPDAEWEDIDSLARAAGISASRLSHLFTEQLGLAPSQYKNFARTQLFIQNYQVQGVTLLRAALQAGFGSYAQFHRVFLQVCGSSPALHLKVLEASPVLDRRVTLGAPPSRPPSESPAAHAV